MSVEFSNKQLSKDFNGNYLKVTVGLNTIYFKQSTSDNNVAEAKRILQEEKGNNRISHVYVLDGTYEYIFVFYEIDDDAYDITEDGNSVTQHARFTLVDGNLYHAEFNVPV